MPAQKTCAILDRYFSSLFLKTSRDVGSGPVQTSPHSGALSIVLGKVYLLCDCCPPPSVSAFKTEDDGSISLQKSSCLLPVILLSSLNNPRPRTFSSAVKRVCNNLTSSSTDCAHHAYGDGHKCKELAYRGFRTIES